MRACGLSSLRNIVIGAGIASLFLVFAGFSGQAEAAFPRILPFSARLKSASTDSAVPDGNYQVVFRFYDDETHGLALWSETQTVPVKNGTVNVNLGEITPIPDSLTFNDGSYWLGITVGSDAEMTPRKKISAVPLALNAGSVDGLTPGTGANNILKLDASGNIDVGGSIATASSLQGGSASVAGLLTAGSAELGGLAVSGATTLDGALAVTGTASIGGNLSVAGNIIPTVGGSFDLGSASNPFNSLYVNNLVVGNASTSGTSNSSYTINDDAAGDEDAALNFYRGGSLTTAQILWNSTADRFDINQSLNVVGDINASGSLKVADTTVCTTSGCVAASGSNHYIQNGTSPQTANFNVTGNGAVGGDMVITGKVGIGTSTPTTSLTFGNAQDQKVMVESSDNVTKGKNLTIAAGNTINYAAGSNFVGLGQANRAWNGIGVMPNGDVYAHAYYGDIYKRTGGTGNFLPLSQASWGWNGIAGAPNGDVYAVTAADGFSGDIFRQAGGTGNFVALNQTKRAWQGVAVDSQGNVYSPVNGGDIYMRAAAGGNFLPLGQTSRAWQGIAVAPNGDIYATVTGGDIYVRPSGGSTFLPLGQVARAWKGITVAPNGNVYASVRNGDIYMRAGGVGDFLPLGQTTRDWQQIAADAQGNVYAGTNGGDIYLQQPATGTANLDGGKLVLQAGVGKGTGVSTISFLTGTPVGSGTDIQALTEKMTIVGNGNVGIGTTTPSYKLDVAGDINSSTALKVGGNTVCTVSGCSAASGSGSYIQNGTSTQSGANFNISGNGVIGGSLAVTGVATVGSLSSSGVVNGTTLNGTTGVNTGASTGTQRIDASGNLVNIGTITATGATTLQATSGTLGLAATGSNIITASTNGSERLRITSAGNVGIGTTTPGRALDIYNSTSPQIRLTQSNGVNFAELQADTNGDLLLSSSRSGLSTVAVYNSLTPTDGATFVSLNFQSKSVEGSSNFTQVMSGNYLGFGFDSFNNVMYAGINGGVRRCITSTGCSTSGNWTTVAISGAGNVTTLAYDSIHKVMYGAETMTNGRIVRCDTTTGTQCANSGDWTIFAPNGLNQALFGMVFDAAHGVLYTSSDNTGASGATFRCDTMATNCSATADWNSAGFASRDWYGLTLDTTNGVLYMPYYNFPGSLGRCATSTGCSTSGNWTFVGVAGNGSTPATVVFDSYNTVLYTSDGSTGIKRCDAVANTCASAGHWNAAGTLDATINALGYDSVNHVVYAGTSSGKVYTCNTSTSCTATINWTNTFTASSAIAGTQKQAFGFDPVNSVMYLATMSGSPNYLYRSATSAPTHSTSYAQIQAVADDTVWGSEDGSLKFLTMQGGSATTAMIIKGGNVGIGTSTPGALLEVLNSADVKNLRLKAVNGQSSNLIEAVDGANANILSVSRGGSQFYNNIFIGSGGMTIGSTTATTTSGVVISGNNHSIQSYDASPLVINAAGNNVGIATSGPDRKLDILDASNPQMRLTQTDGTVYTDFLTNSSGDLTVTPSGGDVTLAGNLAVTGTGTHTFAGTLQVANQTITGTLTVATISSSAAISISAANNQNVNITVTGSGKIRLGSASDNTSFDANGAITFNGAARPYSELQFLPNEAVVPGSGGCALQTTEDTNHAFDTLDCPTAADSWANWQFKMPQNYVNGSTMQVEISWLDADSASTNGAQFNIGYTAVATAADWIGATRTDVAGSSVASAGQGKLTASTISLVTPAINAGDMVSLRVLRKGTADSLPDTVKVIGVKIRFLVGS